MSSEARSELIPCARRHSARGQAGFAVVYLIAGSAVLLLLLSAAALVARVALARAAAAMASDLAALAGAAALRSAAADPCAVAARVAAANEGRLDRCWVDSWDVQVRVSVPVRLPAGRWAGQNGELAAELTGTEARAGPR